MKKSLLVIVMVGVLFAGTASAGNVGFVDLNRLLQSSTAVQGLMLQREKMTKKVTENLSKEEATLLARRTKIAESEKSLSRAEFGKMVDEYAQDEEAFKQKVRGIDSQLTSASSEALQDFQNKAVNPIVTSLAKKNKFQAILNTNTLLYFDPANDITDELITEVNAKMPKIDFPEIEMTKKVDKKASPKKSEKTKSAKK